MKLAGAVAVGVACVELVAALAAVGLVCAQVFAAKTAMYRPNTKASNTREVNRHAPWAIGKDACENFCEDLCA